MPAKTQPERTPARTFTEIARRAQIVRAAIETIAELGYSNASFAQIAQRAGLSSTGLISYHFDSREELIGEVVGDILGTIGDYMAARPAGEQADAGVALRGYIEANVEFIDTHRQEMKALLEISLGGGFAYDADTDQAVISPLQQILRRGQREGVFRSFDSAVMATLVQRAIDGLPLLLAADPALDVGAYGAEVATVFDLATRASG